MISVLSTPVAVTSGTQYRLAFSANNVLWGFQGFVSAGSAAEDFTNSYASFPPSPWVQSDATTRTYAVGMGVV